MGLVDDEGVVFEQVTVGADLGQQHAVGDKLHQRLRRRLVIEADLGANLPSPLDTEFFGQTPRQRGSGDAARLRHGDFRLAATPRLQADLRDLCRLARTRVAGDDDDGMLLDGGADLFNTRRDRQFHREIDPSRRQGALPRNKSLL